MSSQKEKCMTNIEENSILNNVRFPGTQISLSLEYSQAYSYERLFTNFSLYFLRDSTLDFIFPLVNPHWLLGLTNSILTVNWLSAKQKYFFCIQRRSTRDSLCGFGITDQTGRWGLVCREIDSCYWLKNSSPRCCSKTMQWIADMLVHT